MYKVGKDPRDLVQESPIHPTLMYKVPTTESHLAQKGIYLFAIKESIRIFVEDKRIMHHE